MLSFDIESLRGLTDLRIAVRQLLRRKGASAVAVVTLALGIGATVSVFSIVEAVLRRPLPYADPGRLVRVWNQTPSTFNRLTPRVLNRWPTSLRLIWQSALPQTNRTPRTPEKNRSTAMIEQRPHTSR